MTRSRSALRSLISSGADTIRNPCWRLDTGISNNTGFSVDDVRCTPRYKTAADVVIGLVDVVSKNGGLLLNIAPRADGTIPPAEQKILLEVGPWLQQYGEAIGGTRPWTVHGEGQPRPRHPSTDPFVDPTRDAFTSADIRFTTRQDTSCALVMAWPDDGQLSIRSLGHYLRSSADGPVTVERVNPWHAGNPLG